MFTIISLINFARYGEDTLFVLKCVMSGTINSFGFILVNHATTTGHAGPAAALVNVQTILHTLLGAAVLGQIPSEIQITAVIIGIVGSLCIT